MSDRPSDGGGSARSDAASRLAALLADVVDDPATPSASVPPASTPEDAPRRTRRVLRPAPAEVPAADPDATQPIPRVLLPIADDDTRRTDDDAGGTDHDAGGIDDGSPAGDTTPSATRPPRPITHDGDDEVLAEARAALRAQPTPMGAPPTGPLRKQPGRAWSRADPAASPPAAPRPTPAAPAAPAPAPAPPAHAAPAPDPAPPAATPAPAPPAPVAAAPPAPAPPVSPPPTPAASSRPASAPAPPPPPVATADDDDDDDGDDAPPPALVDDGARAPRLTLRAVAFGVALALLVAAVPALGWVGKDRLLDSRGGVVVEGGIDASEPGYRALVNPTPTGLVVHRDGEGDPVSATVLSLGASDGGGTVLLMPLTLQIHEPTVFNTIIEAYEQTGDDDAFRRGFEDVIGVSVPPPIIDVTDESLATLVAPVAPLSLTVNDPVIADDGTIFEGPVSLAAEEVGPYMRATREGEPEIARLERLRDVWAAWLDAIGEATVSEPIGAAATGMGSFLRELAAGEPVVETLGVEPGIPVTFMQAPFYVPGPDMEEQVIDAVPFPLSPREGRRVGIKLLNGAEGETLPMPLMRDIILAGGSLITLGNAEAFGQEDTLIEYAGDDWREAAEAMQELLGETAEIDEMSARRAEAEAEDMVITIGSDVLSRYQEQGDGGG